MRFFKRFTVALAGALLSYPAFASLAILPTGATSQQLQVRAVVQSSGAPDTALAFNTSGLSCSYQRPGGSVTSITLATQTVTGAYSSGGFVHLANGWYRLDVPDAALATGVGFVTVTCAATGDTFVDGRIDLSPSINVSSWNSVLLATTNPLPNAAPAAAGGLPTFGSGSGQLNPSSGAMPVSGDLTATMKTSVQTAATAATPTASLATGAIVEGTFNTTCGSIKQLGIVRQCTAVNVTSTTLVMDSPAAFADNDLAGMTLVACGATQGYCESRLIASNIGSTDTITLTSAWQTTPTGATTFYVFATAPGSAGVPTASENAIATWDLLTSGHVGAGTFGAQAKTVIDALTAAIGTPSNLGSGASLAGNAVDIENETDDIGVNGAGLTAADDAVMTRLGAPAGASLAADLAAVKADTAGVANIPANIKATTIGGERLDDLLCRIASIMYGQADYNGTNQTVFKNPAGSATRVTITYGTDNGDRIASSLGTNCGP